MYRHPLDRFPHLRARRALGGGGHGGSVTAVPSPTGPLASSANATTPVGGGNGPALFDDTAIDEGRNGQPAAGGLYARLIEFANQIAYAGKPLFNWMNASGSDGFDDASGSPAFRQIYNGRNYGAVTEGISAHYYPDPGNAFDGKGWSARLNETTFTHAFNYSTVVTDNYPLSLLQDTITGTRGFTAANSELAISSRGGAENSPVLWNGVVWQEPQDLVDPAVSGSYIDSSGTVTGKSAYTGLSGVRTGSPIIGVRSDDADAIEVMQKLRIQLLNTHQWRRTQIGWSAENPDSNVITMSTSKNQFRYVHDQTYGTGGTAFSETGPADTLPIKRSSAAFYKQVRVYVFVYAAMSGTTDTGTLAIANRNSSGVMATSASAVTNPITISGTTFKWYPDKVSSNTASLNLATAPYFQGYAGALAQYDRVALCAKSSGTTDSVKIGAWTMIAVGSPF